MPGAVGDPTVVLDRPGGFSTAVAADALWTAPAQTAGAIWYQSSADVTALLRANGPCAYRVAGVDSQDLASVADKYPFAGWSVVFYQRPARPCATSPSSTGSTW